MVRQLSRSQIPPRQDPHDWNSWDHYQSIHESRLSQHPFVVSFRDTLGFAGGTEGVISLLGVVHCRKDVMLEVEKWFDTRYFGNTLRVRCHTYVYVGWIRGEHLLLKYHNLHRDRNEYIHRVYDPATGKQMFYEVLQRYQFPTFPEVLDELEYLARDL